MYRSKCSTLMLNSTITEKLSYLLIKTIDMLIFTDLKLHRKCDIIKYKD